MFQFQYRLIIDSRRICSKLSFFSIFFGGSETCLSSWGLFPAKSLKLRGLFLANKSKGLRYLFVVDSLDKQMQNEKELIRLASAGVEGLFFVCVKSVNFA